MNTKRLVVLLVIAIMIGWLGILVISRPYILPTLLQPFRSHCLMDSGESLSIWIGGNELRITRENAKAYISDPVIPGLVSQDGRDLVVIHIENYSENEIQMNAAFKRYFCGTITPVNPD